jgi:hypothetical protein
MPKAHDKRVLKGAVSAQVIEAEIDWYEKTQS